LDEEPGITRLIDGVERMGFLVRARSVDDRRRVDCRITKAGLQVLQHLDGPVDELDRKMLHKLTRAEVRELTRLMDSIDNSD